MYLNWDTAVEHVFFKWWTADTPFSTTYLYHYHLIWVGFIVSLVIIFAMCFAYEGLIAFRARYDSYLTDSSLFPLDNTKCKKYHHQVHMGPLIVCSGINFSQQLVRSGLFAFSNGSSLFIMMIFMLFNGYMCISCVAGAFAGHLFFSLYMPEEVLSKRPRSCCD